MRCERPTPLAEEAPAPPAPRVLTLRTQAPATAPFLAARWARRRRARPHRSTCCRKPPTLPWVRVSHRQLLTSTFSRSAPTRHAGARARAQYRFYRLGERSGSLFRRRTATSRTRTKNCKASRQGSTERCTMKKSNSSSRDKRTRWQRRQQSRRARRVKRSPSADRLVRALRRCRCL